MCIRDRYLIESGSNRFGALDFQTSPTQYVPRDEAATLDELHEAAIMVDDGRPLPQPLAEALIRGTSIGGARPKALLVDSDGTQWIAKFSSSSDTHFSVPNAEGATRILAQHAGIDVCEVRVTSSLGREILLVRRFDRTSAGGRIHAVSALSLIHIFLRWRVSEGLTHLVQPAHGSPVTGIPECLQLAIPRGAEERVDGRMHRGDVPAVGLEDIAQPVLVDHGVAAGRGPGVMQPEGGGVRPA